MVVTKQALPDDPVPLDCPPFYDTARADLTRTSSTPRENSLAPVNISISASDASLSSSPTSSGKHPALSNPKGKGKGWFSLTTSKPAREVRTKVLGFIRDLVTEQDQKQNSDTALETLERCKEECEGYNLRLSVILQVKSIEGHTPMYWAIANRAPVDDDEEHGKVKAVPELLISYAMPLNAATIADIRNACLVKADQPLFQRLRMFPEIALLSQKDKMLLGTIPPDEIIVENVIGVLGKGTFTAWFEVPLFQKRMRMLKRVQLDFIAQARMWRLEFLIAESSSRNRDEPQQGSWCISLSLLENSRPTQIDSYLIVPDPSSACLPPIIDGPQPFKHKVIQPKPSISMRLHSLEHLGPPPSQGTRLKFHRNKGLCKAIVVPLDERLQHSGTSYITPDDTLKARLEAQLIVVSVNALISR